MSPNRARVRRHNKILDRAETPAEFSTTAFSAPPLKHTYFMNVVDGMFCPGRACDKQTRDAFQPSLLNGVRR